MESNYFPIAEYIRLVDERNTESQATTLLGVSINKYFMPSVANVIGTDLTKYKVIRKYQFACSLMQVSRDEKIPIDCLMDYDLAMVSPAYYVFEVIDTSKLMPEYLSMWFKRSEFDREASFLGVGGVRGSMTWDDFCGMKLPIPSIDKQKAIVKAYKTITDRIALKRQINDNLEATCISIYEKLSMSANASVVPLGSIAKYATQRSKFKELVVKHYLSNENLLKDKKGISGYSVCPDDEAVILFSTGDTLIGNIRPYFKKIYLCESDGGCNADVLVIRANESRFQELIFCALSQNYFFDYIMSGSTGTKMPRGDKNHILLYKVVIPSDESLDSFIMFAKSAIEAVRKNKREQDKLTELQEVLLSRLSEQIYL